MHDKTPDNYESRKKLIDCAKSEFLEKGFAKASLRKIASDAGLTTGAVYFFFGDKNGLLEGVIGDALSKLMRVIEQHLAEDLESDLAVYRQQDGDHDAFTESLVDVIYDNLDEMTILLDRSAGSKYEGFVDGLIDRLDRSYIALAEKYALVTPGKRVNKQMLHWLCHVQINAFIHMIQHEKDKENALHFIMPVMNMLIKDWMEYSLENEV